MKGMIEMKVIGSRLISTGSLLFRRLCTATATATSEAVAATGAEPVIDNVNNLDRRLFVRLSALGAKGAKGKASDVLNSYISKGRTIQRRELLKNLRSLRKYKRYKVCLEILEWMDEHGYVRTEREHGVYMDIIYKTKGMKGAEDYFNGLSPASKNLYSYGALLNCYCMEELVDKAIPLFKEMEELNYLTTHLPFNNIMRLYVNAGKPDRVPVLLQDMKNRGVSPDTYTYYMLLQSYADMNDPEGIDRIVEELEKEQKYTWSTYTNLASIYNKLGLPDKAESAMQKLEEFLMKGENPEPMAYNYMITLYAGFDNLDGVYRAWEALKARIPHCVNTSYLTMLQTLSRLGDIEGLRSCYDEWEDRCQTYDNRLAAVAIYAYLKHDMLDEAEEALERGMKRSTNPFILGHEYFLDYFFDKGEKENALKHLEYFENLEEAELDKWRSAPFRMSKALAVFGSDKDVEGAERIYRLLKKFKCLNSKVYFSLLEIYVAAEKKEPGMRKRMEEDGIPIGEEHEELLNIICSHDSRPVTENL